MGGRGRTIGTEGRERPRRRLLRLAVVAGVVAGAFGLAPQPAEAEPSYYVPTDACGTKVRKTDTRDFWDCTFVDDFTTGSLDGTKWMAQTSAQSNYTLGGECIVDTPQHIGFGNDWWSRGSTNGFLRLTARREAAVQPCVGSQSTWYTQYTGAQVMTYLRFGQTYGRYEVRARNPQVSVPGAQFSFWLYPVDLQPMGEIDPMEWYSAYPDRGIPMLHGASEGPYTNQSCVLASTVGGWHTYTIEWTPRSIRIWYDGDLCLETTDWVKEDPNHPEWKMPVPFNRPVMIALTVGLSPGFPQNPATPLPDSWSADIDYVKAWA